MKNVHMIDDFGLGNVHGTVIRIPTVKMTCDCGWVDKANADRDAPQRAENHLRTRHNGGAIHYAGHSYLV